MRVLYCTILDKWSVFTLTGHYVFITVFLLVLLRLSDQTVVQWLQVLQILSIKQLSKKSYLCPTKRFVLALHAYLSSTCLPQTPVRGPSAPKVLSSFSPQSWASARCTGRREPPWPEAERSAHPLWSLVHLEKKKKQRQWLDYKLHQDTKNPPLRNARCLQPSWDTSKPPGTPPNHLRCLQRFLRHFQTPTLLRYLQIIKAAFKLPEKLLTHPSCLKPTRVASNCLRYYQLTWDTSSLSEILLTCLEYLQFT